MHRRLMLFCLSILLSLVTLACTPSPTQQATKIINTPVATSTQQKSKEPAKRVIALTSLSADIIYQLDKTKLVGIAGSSLLNNDPRFKDTTRVASGRTQPNLEKIAALKPDLVIAASGFSDQIIDRLQELKINTLQSKIDSWKSLEDLTNTLAQEIGANPQPLLERYQKLLAQSNLQVSNTSTLVLVSRQPILTPNKNSWAGDMLNQFKVNNIAADLQGNSPISGYVPLSPEKILEANPQIIIVTNSPQSNSEQQVIDGFKKEPFWQKLQASKSNRIYVFDYHGLVNPGSIDAIEKAAQKLQEIVTKV